MLPSPTRVHVVQGPRMLWLMGGVHHAPTSVIAVRSRCSAEAATEVIEELLSDLGASVHRPLRRRRVAFAALARIAFEYPMGHIGL